MAKDIHAQSVPLPKFPMSGFDLGYSFKYCTKAGLMNLHYIEECIPSDIAHIRTDLFMRLDPLTFPIMHKVKIRQNFFFVPTRLILGDELQEEFFSCKDMSAKLPKLTFSGTYLDGFGNPLGKNTLFDMAGCQPVDTPDTSENYVIRNPLPFLCYQKIWADFYADEIYDQQELQIQDSTLAFYRQAGLNGSLADSLAANALHYQYVSYSKDRFTSAQPDAQRVGEVYLMNPLRVASDNGSLGDYNSSGISLVGVRISDSSVIAGGTDSTSIAGNLANPRELRPTLTIDELWDEMAVQRFLNSLNEFGNERYIEILAGQFGVISADARLQRAQWLGGNECVVNVSEVLQTSETTANSPLGALGGRGIVSGRGRDLAFRVPEHGYIIGIQSIVPENGYASGSPRWLYKQMPLDFAMPRFNNLGEQAVFDGELCSDHLADANTADLGEFGYQPQYDEYRSHPSRASMDFRESQFLAWHLDRKFTSAPPLNRFFIHVDPSETNRIFNDTDADAFHYRVHAFHKAMYVRPISRHPIPGKL